MCFMEMSVSKGLWGFITQKIVLTVTDVGTSNTIFIHFYGSQLSERKYLCLEIAAENFIPFLCCGHKIHVAYIKRLFPR
jgi:hypothetical protein